LDKVASGDGTSMTIMVSENIQATTWADASFLDTKLASRPLLAREKAGTPTNVFVWHNSNKAKQSWLINGATESGPTPLDTARPSSEHKGGVNTAFADGHVVFLKDSIDYTVYARLMSSDGKKCMRDFIKNGSKSRIDHTVPLSDTDLQ
jgi:prepilin-type processing-associated H-X9-DG protein